MPDQPGQILQQQGWCSRKGKCFCPKVAARWGAARRVGKSSECTGQESIACKAIIAPQDQDKKGLERGAWREGWITAKLTLHMLAFSRQWAKWLLRKMYITHVCSLQRVINCAIMAMKLGFLEIHLKLQKNKTLALEGDRVCFLETVGPNPLSDVERRWIPSTKRVGDRERMQPFQQDYSCLPPHYCYQ